MMGKVFGFGLRVPGNRRAACFVGKSVAFGEGMGHWGIVSASRELFGSMEAAKPHPQLLTAHYSLLTRVAKRAGVHHA